jgi:hypothetical protein
MRIIKVSLIFCMLIFAEFVRADQPVSTATEVFKGFDIYATTIVQEDTVWKQWFAGWMTESDLPWDRMFYSVSEDSGSTWTTPVLAFTIENVQVNDPSVLRLWDAENSRYYYQMYYTYYPSGLGDPTNYIAVSTSLDGLSWSHHGVLIEADNGIDMDGAWAPTVYSVDSIGSEVYLYFHNNHPDGQIFRTTLSNKGLTFDKSSTIAVTSSGGLRANPDVSRSPDGTWWMFYNGSSATSGGEGNFNTRKMYSADGVNWMESVFNPIQQYEDMTTTTPHVVWTARDTYQLWYGFGTPSFLDFDVYMQIFTSETEPEQSVVASSEALEALGASMAVDGDPLTFWSSAGHAGSGNHTEWIYLDQDKVRDVSVVELTPRSVSGTAMCFPSDFVIQQSSGGLSWTDIPGTSFSDYQCADSTTQTFRFESIISNQYFRLFATKLNADSYGNYYCQIAEMTLALDTTVGINSSPHMTDPEILQNYPNPFQHSTTISFSLQKTEHVSLVVYDILGHKVSELLDEVQSAGYHNIQWDASQLTGREGGVYFVRLSTEGTTLTRKMLRIQ